MHRLKLWLSSLSPRLGAALLAVCALCYAISFAQMALPLPVGAKAAVWAVFFGLAKAAQYSALAILGKEGIKRLRSIVRSRLAKEGGGKK